MSGVEGTPEAARSVGMASDAGGSLSDRSSFPPRLYEGELKVTYYGDGFDLSIGDDNCLIDDLIVKEGRWVSILVGPYESAPAEAGTSPAASGTQSRDARVSGAERARTLLERLVADLNEWLRRG